MEDAVRVAVETRDGNLVMSNEVYHQVASVLRVVANMLRTGCILQMQRATNRVQEEMDNMFSCRGLKFARAIKA